MTIEKLFFIFLCFYRFTTSPPSFRSPLRYRIIYPFFFLYPLFYHPVRDSCPRNYIRVHRAPSSSSLSRLTTPPPPRRATGQVGRLVFSTSYFCVDVLEICLSTRITGHESTTTTSKRPPTRQIVRLRRTLIADL